MQPTVDLHALAPEIVLSVTILVVLVVDAFLPMSRRWLALPLAVSGLVATFVAVLTLVGEERVTLAGAFVVDDFALLFKGFFLVVGLAVLVLSSRTTRSETPYPGEYTFLLLCSFLGCLVLPSVRDMLTLFIAIELVSAPAFILAAFRKGDLRSNEAGLKFFLFGVIASAVMLYGMSLLYGLTGSTGFGQIAGGLARMGPEPAAAAAVLFVLGGLAFKVSAVPFHFWAPDTYEGAPIPVAAYLSVASKAAGFVGLALLCFLAFAPLAPTWTPVVAIVSVLTMSLGNLVALQQRHIVRLLSYSSIAQAGYMLLPFALVGTSAETSADALAAVAIYIIIYAAMNLGAFAVVVGLSREVPSGMISEYSGLFRRAPLMAVAMSAFLISLAGIPPAAGFWAKFFVFRVAIEAGGMGPWLAGFMVVNSVVGLFYYLAVVRTMLRTETAGEPISIDRSVKAVVAVAAVLIVAWFVLPDLVVNLTRGFTGG